MEIEDKFRSAVTVLGRLVTNHPNKAGHLRNLLLSNPVLGGQFGARLAQELGSSVGEIIESITSYDASDQTLAASFRRAIYPHLPWPTIVLRKTAVAVLQQVVHDVRNHVQRQYSEYELAQALIAWGTWLGEAGETRRAYEAEEEAKRILEQRDTPSDRLLMNSAITNMLIHARRIGESQLEILAIEQASRAVQIVRKEYSEDFAAYVPGIRRILMNMAWSKFNLGMFEEALEDNQLALQYYSEIK